MPALLIAATLALAAARPAARAGGDDDLLIAQLQFRSRVTVRVRTETVVAPPAYLELREKRGPKCVAPGSVLGAAVIAGNSVDFILRGGGRVRARFKANCPGLDFYSGFYLTPGPDGLVCGGRDAVRSRAGGECAIDRFRLLLPKHGPSPPQP